MRTKTFTADIKADAEGLAEGEFEALVSVFGNVDGVGDVVMPGAFAEDLEAWKASGDPIPVIWSHAWHDPDYHIGEVIDAKETDEGLVVRARMDFESPKAKQVWRLLKGRRVKQFSFAYDIEDAGWGERDGQRVYELRKLHVFEVGPTLVGANQETDLLATGKADWPPEVTERVRALVAEEIAKSQQHTGKATESVAANEEDPAGGNSEEPSLTTPASARLLIDVATCDVG